ncbi:MAG: proline dehydrogenase family protein [Solirubrobacterales bacterium]|nr:proline dehydrogenase family protein [Solirubrobacterales bacterium]
MPFSLRRPLFALATSDRFERAVRATWRGEMFAYHLAARYVAGLTVDDALTTARALAATGVLSSIDLFGENVAESVKAERTAEAYVELAGRLSEAPPGTYLSLDLSHLGLDELGAGPQRRLDRVAAALPAGSCIQVGAEQAARADRTLEAVLAAARAGGAVSATVQANLRRSERDAEALAEAGVPIRLVKGAYVEAPTVARPWGEATDLAFVELAHRLQRGGATLYLATHDRVLREALLPALPGIGVEMLLGVRPEDHAGLVARGVPVRVYVPYGDEWFRYAMRRAAEWRGAR